MRQGLTIFFNKYYYVATIMLLVFLFWWLDQTLIGMILVALLACMSTLFSEDLKPFATAFVSYTFLCTPNFIERLRSLDRTIIIFGSILLVLVIITLLVYYYRHRIEIRSRFTLGSLFVGMVLAMIVAVLAGIGSPYFTWLSFSITLGCFIFMICFYVVFRNTLTVNLKQYLAYVMVGVGIVVSLEMLVYYVNHPISFDIPLRLEVGWGIKNTIGVLIAFAIPMCLYLGYRSKQLWCYLIIAFLLYGALIATLSRGNVFIITAMLPLMLLYFYYKTPYRKMFLYSLAGLIGLTCISYLCFHQTINGIIISYLNRGLDDSSRWELWHKVFEMGKGYRIFGISYRGTIEGFPFVGTLLKAHSTILQIFISNGIIGLIGFSKFFYDRYKLIIKAKVKDPFWFVGTLVILTFALYGLIDLNFFIIYEAFFVFLILIVLELDQTNSIIENDVLELE